MSDRTETKVLIQIRERRKERMRGEREGKRE